MATPLNILMVEDSQDDALLLAYQLRRAGFDANWKRVQTEADFLANLHEPPDIILCDYSMPQFNGLRAVELLRERGLETPFILISGTLGEEAAVEAIKCGADDYLLKDKLTRLGHAIQRALEQKKYRDERKRSELRVAAFSVLGQKLSSAKTAREAAEIIVETADRLFGWNMCALDLYLPQKDRMRSVLRKDIINGVRSECPPIAENIPLSPRARSVIEKGAELILREEPFATTPDLVPTGDTTRPSASLMFVPIRDGAKVIGVFSIQSYTPKAYTPQDLNELQSLADHCGGALHRIQTEQALRESEQQFRQAQKMESIGQLAGGVAHDFNNILTVIQMHASLLLADPTMHEMAKESSEQISLAAERAANLTRQLLTFSRKQLMQPRVLALNDVVGNMIKMLKRILGEDISLQVNYNSKSSIVRADPGMMEQVLLNLSVNARDAMPKGGKLVISTSDEFVEGDFGQMNPQAAAGQYVCLSVNDTGTGIPPEILPRIFEPFFTTKGVGHGTGLGLATVYGIVHQHHGWIKVYSEVEKGTVFRIYLPAVEAGAQLEAQRKADTMVRGGTETILIVEDETAVRALVRNVLERYGYKILDAATGHIAQEIWREHHSEIDLLLTDMVMPDKMTGPELAEKLKLEKPSLAVVFTSGYNADVVAKDFVLQEGINFLQKPYPPPKLAQTIRTALDQRAKA